LKFLENGEVFEKKKKPAVRCSERAGF